MGRTPPLGRSPKDVMPIRLPLYSSGPPESPALESPRVSGGLLVSLVVVHVSSMGRSVSVPLGSNGREGSLIVGMTPATVLVPPRRFPLVPVVLLPPITPPG